MCNELNLLETHTSLTIVLLFATSKQLSGHEGEGE